MKNLGERVLLATYKTTRHLEGFILTRRASGGHSVTLYLQDTEIIEEDSSSITLAGVVAYERDPERFYGSDLQIFFEPCSELKTKISHYPFEGSVCVPHGNIYIGSI